MYTQGNSIIIMHIAWYIVPYCFGLQFTHNVCISLILSYPVVLVYQNILNEPVTGEILPVIISIYVMLIIIIY